MRGGVAQGDHILGTGNQMEEATPPFRSQHRRSDVRGLAHVTVVIPALNEATSLPLVLRDLPPAQRVIVVNNGSTDGTAAVAFAHGATVV